jgi:hypothetical protein
LNSSLLLLVLLSDPELRQNALIFLLGLLLAHHEHVKPIKRDRDVLVGQNFPFLLLERVSRFVQTFKQFLPCLNPLIALNCTLHKTATFEHLRSFQDLLRRNTWRVHKTLSSQGILADRFKNLRGFLKLTSRVKAACSFLRQSTGCEVCSSLLKDALRLLFQELGLPHFLLPCLFVLLQ